ncbi:class I poly(R)-hydroxyalkanoic acid synthase [soil metagenome]
MNTQNPQSLSPEWLSQITQPGMLQAWLNTQNPAASSLTKNINELGAVIDPVAAARLQQDYMDQATALWNDLCTMKTPALGDKRFAGSEWNSSQLHGFNAAVYLLNGRFLKAMAEAVQAPPKAKQKIRFAVQQMIDAMAPSNFLVSNPEAQKKIIETKGESLTKGLMQMLGDMRKGRISQTDESAFEVGKNVATSEGMVVFENELFQLIQYKPLTKTVFERPLLIVPPCINKFYILDLQPENSVVRYAVEQGHTVFVVSWVNPDESLGHLTWDHYVEDAVIRAIHLAQEISGQDQVNSLGFCVGGTLISAALSILYARGEMPVASLTLLTSLLDFSDTGAIDVYIDEAQVVKREKAIGQSGLMPAADFSAAFSSLRPNDLVWSYVASNYLKGENPPPFDLLYWNSDSTNLPGPMFCWYLRNMYLDDSLKVPGKLAVKGEKIDLGKIDTPTFIYASREDHIVPWASAYQSTRLLNPKNPKRNRFLLGASGHIAGVINPPSKNKRSYWNLGSKSALPESADEWLATATEHPGSWWPEWSDFLATYAGKKVAAPRKFGNAKYKPIEPAPGRYVKVKAESPAKK